MKLLQAEGAAQFAAPYRFPKVAPKGGLPRLVRIGGIGAHGGTLKETQDEEHFSRCTSALRHMGARL